MTPTLEFVALIRLITAMVPLPVTEPYSLEGQRREETFKVTMGSWITITTIRTMTILCRCMCSSKAATRESRGNKCNTNKFPGRISRHIRIWQLFIIKGRPLRSLKVASKLSLEHNRFAIMRRIGAAPREWRMNFKIIRTPLCNSTYRWDPGNTLRSNLRSLSRKVSLLSLGVRWKSSLNERKASIHTHL